jgi:DNA-binding CsgD family transcriptional regulator
MRFQERRAGDFADATESEADSDAAALVQLVSARMTSINEAKTVLARELNGALTALLLYMGEIKQHSHALAQTSGDKSYLQTIVQNALEQTERLCALVEQIAGTEKPAKTAGSAGGESRSDHGRLGRDRRATPAQDAGAKLTRREREVLTLIGEGCTNKQGAQKMQISPRTFESHRAEVMRKLGARNTADLVRAALLLSTDQD